jgi:uncharacterized membrane protein YwaF
MAKIKIIPAIFNIASVSTAMASSIYLCAIAMRTDLFSRTTAVGGDVVLIVAAVCFVGLLSSIIAFRFRKNMRGLVLTMLVLNTLASLAYLMLFAMGKFGPFEI